MKLERLNENTIRCVIDKSELLARHIDIEDMTYGSENTSDLFEEMLDKANVELGFSPNKSLVIEAVPLIEGSIELFISKVDSPDELDVRFSKFSPTKQNKMFPAFFEMLEGAFDKLEEELRVQNMQGLQNINSNANLKEDMRKEDSYISIFSFESIDKATDASKRINGINFESSLFKDEKNKRYFLALSIDKNAEKDELEQFNKICNLLAEYGEKVQGMGYNLAYYKEHYQIIIQDDAVDKLSKL